MILISRRLLCGTLIRRFLVSACRNRVPNICLLVILCYAISNRVSSGKLMGGIIIARSRHGFQSLDLVGFLGVNS